MNKKILIIDDDIDFVASIKVVLETKYDVLTAYSGEEGWQMLDEMPDLIILDVLMDKRGEGFIFSRKMRKEEKYSKIPILMLTGMREQTGFFFPKNDPRDERFLPVNEFVEKPIQPQDLLEKVEKLLKNKELEALASFLK